MAATDATPIPIKNQAYRAYFPIYDNDGDLVTGATGLDSERSLDGATVADCTNEATEIATSSGLYYLDLTAAEMNTSCTIVKVKSTSTDSKDAVLVFYPQESGDIKVDVQSWLGTAVATPTVAGVPEVDITHIQGGTQTVTDLKDFADAGYDPATNKVEGVKLVDTTTTNTDMVAAAPTAAANADAVWDEAKAGHVGAGSFGEEVQTHALSTEISALNDVSAADVNAQCDTAIADAALATAAALTTVDANVDAILVDTGTTLENHLTDIKGATFSGATDSLEAIRDRGDAAWITGSGTGLTALATGTAQGGSASTIQLAAGETFADDEMNGNVVKVTGGTGAGQARVITDYVGSTDTATVTPNWITNPDATSTYEIVEGSMNLTAISNDAQSAADLKDFADAGYDPATNKVEGVKLVDTTTTNTDMLTNSGIADAVWDEASTGHVTAGTYGEIVPTLSTSAEVLAVEAKVDIVDTNVDSILDDTGTSGVVISTATQDAIAGQVWDEAKAGHVTAGTFGEEVQDHATSGEIAALNDPSAATIADAVWDEAKAGHVGVGSFGEEVQAHALSTEVSAVETKVDTVDTVVDGIQTDLDNGTDGLGAIKGDTAAILTDTADMQPKIGTPAADVSADIAAVKVDTAAILVDGPQKLTKNTAYNNFTFMMLNSTDHVTPQTGETVTAQRSIDGAAFGACANSVTEIGNGWYKINLAASDLNGDNIALKFTAGTSDQTNISIITQPT